MRLERPVTFFGLNLRERCRESVGRLGVDSAI